MLAEDGSHALGMPSPGCASCGVCKWEVEVCKVRTCSSGLSRAFGRLSRRVDLSGGRVGPRVEIVLEWPRVVLIAMTTTAPLLHTYIHTYFAAMSCVPKVHVRQGTSRDFPLLPRVFLSSTSSSRHLVPGPPSDHDLATIIIPFIACPQELVLSHADAGLDPGSDPYPGAREPQWSGCTRARAAHGFANLSCSLDPFAHGSW